MLTSYAALLVMKIHSIEMAREIAPSPTELELLEHIKGILEEAYYDFSESISLAAGVARAWAMFLQDVSLIHLPPILLVLPSWARCFLPDMLLIFIETSRYGLGV
jgi:hypothetical protein